MTSGFSVPPPPGGYKAAEGVCHLPPATPPAQSLQAMLMDWIWEPLPDHECVLYARGVDITETDYGREMLERGREYGHSFVRLGHGTTYHRPQDFLGSEGRYQPLIGDIYRGLGISGEVLDG